MLSHALAFAVASALIILLPGPDTMVTLRSLLRGGRPAGTRAALGVLTGLSVWVVAATFGVSALLRASHDGYLALRLVGAAYLVVLGLQAWRSRGAVGEVLADAQEPPRAGLLGGGFHAGLLTDLLNPKVGVFFVSFLPAFVPSGSPTGPTSLALGSVFVVETAVYFVVLLRGADRVLRLLRRPRARRTLERATGSVLVGLGVRLAAER